jgi:6-phosphogluconolactonase/glucosamine-6-phosphate isomerase/deaminase
VRVCLEGEISPMLPASILRRHLKATAYLDHASASLLSPKLHVALTEYSPVTLDS